MHDPANSMDEIIRRATEEGRFDDLPGRGKPLKLEQNPHERPDWRLANHLLKENDFTLPWIADRQEIEAWLAQERQALERAWKWFVQHPDEQVSWDTARRNFRQQVELINKRIWNYNLGVPSSGFQRMKVNSNREIERVMAGGQAEK